MGPRTMGNLHEMLATLDKFSADRSIDEQRIAIRIVATDLRLAAAQEAIIAHPVGDVMREPRGSLGPVVISTRSADFKCERLVPMHALRAIRHVEAISDTQPRMLRLHFPGDFVRSDVQPAPALRVTNEAG